MALRYPLLFIILIIGLIIILLRVKKHKPKFKNGFKIANTEYLKKDNYYLSLKKKYNLLKKGLQISCIICILVCILLICRLYQVKETKSNEYNRDIYLCMDVSASVYELNKDIVESLKNTIKSLDNERFGISIFNSSSVTLVPLTNDYDYILKVMDEIDKSLDANISNNIDYSDPDSFYIRNYLRNGTEENASLQGGSLIGDGLATCTYNFSDPDNKRTKIIILTTDNDLQGSPLLSLEEASLIAKNKNITVFGIGTNNIYANNEENFKEAVANTNGKYYKISTNTSNEIVSDIEKTSKSLLENQSEKIEIDIPQIPFIILIITFVIYIFISKKVK